jgi:membrane protein implicated in regulation of membrane protease activity
LITAVVFAVGEMATPGSFFLLPFAVGAAAAAVLAFAGVELGAEWLAFLVVSIGCLLALRPLARRLDASSPAQAGVGASRLIGEVALVLEDIPAGNDVGLVRIHREEWRAQSEDHTPIAAGERARVVEVRGTQVIVRRADALAPTEPGGQPL